MSVCEYVSMCEYVYVCVCLPFLLWDYGIIYGLLEKFTLLRSLLLAMLNKIFLWEGLVRCVISFLWAAENLSFLILLSS